MTFTIGLDWGTSRLRGLLMAADGRVVEERTREWGIRQLPAGGFAAALADVTDGWPSVPIVASGMVGSRQGWREAPYVDTPATLADVCAAQVDVVTADGRHVAIMPGVRDPAGPDVMRGEETQVFGALDAHPEWAGDAQLVLPGTHSKWVHVTHACITRFATFMTGELYGLLCRHSILAATGTAADVGAAVREAAFAQGVTAARDSGAAGALSCLFSARVLMLEGRLASAAVPDYLSGLLIGEEWRAARAAGWHADGRRVALVGDAALCARYRQAAMLFDLPEPVVISDAAARGLWHIARAASAHAVDPSVEMP